MKNFLFISIICLVINYSCSNETDTFQESESLGAHETLPDAGKYIKLYETPLIQSFITREIHNYKGKRNGTMITPADIDTSRLLVTTFSDDYKSYSLNITTSMPEKIYNIVFKEFKGNLYVPAIIEYTVSPSFAIAYNNGQKSFDEYEGTITQHNYTTFFSASRDVMIDCDCWNIYRSLPYKGGPAGSGSSINDFPINNGNLDGDAGGSGSVSNNGGNSGQGNTGSGVQFIPPINSGCSFLPLCGFGSFPIYIPNCGFICLPFLGGGGGGDENLLLETYTSNVDINKRDEVECVNMLLGIGLITGPDNKINTSNEATLNPFIQQLNNCLLRNDIENKINKLKQNSIFDPCTGNEILIDIDQLASDLCFGCKEGELTPENLETAYYNSLNNTDYIIIDATFKECPKFLCIYNALKNSENSVWCETFDNYFNNEQYHIILRAGNKNPDGTTLAHDGSTDYIGNFATITINKNQCDNHYLEIAGTILHESIHARLYLNAKQLDHTVTKKDYWKIFYLNPKTSDISHEYMAKKYVGILAESLRTFDGSRYDIDYYMYIAWTGLSDIGEEFNLLKDKYINEYFDENNIVLNAPATIDCK